MDRPEDTARGSRKKRIIGLTGLAVLAALVVVFWPACPVDESPPEETAGAFDWFEDQARRLDRDPAKVVAFVRDEVHSLAYRGDVKGPLGALWDASGSQLRDLPLTEQVKRHVRRHLDAGRLVVVPSRTVDVAGYETAAFFSHDTKTGHIEAIAEDGLHGSTSMAKAWGGAQKSLAKDLKESKGKMGAIHMYRGALIAWWTFARYRLEGQTVREAVKALLVEMDAWEASTNMLTGLEKYAGGKVRGKLAAKMNQAMSNVDGAGARAAFKIGYLGSTVFLSTWPGDPEER